MRTKLATADDAVEVPVDQTHAEGGRAFRDRQPPAMRHVSARPPESERVAVRAHLARDPFDEGLMLHAADYAYTGEARQGPSTASHAKVDALPLRKHHRRMDNLTPRQLREEIGRRIAHARKARGKSQRAFAAEMGISYTTPHFWEHGEYGPDNAELHKIGRVLQISVEWLIYGDERYVTQEQLENVVRAPRLMNRR